KVWRQWTPLKILAGVGGAALLAGAGWWIVRNWATPHPLGRALAKFNGLSVGDLVTLTGIVLALVALRYVADKVFHYQKRFGELPVVLTLAPVGCAAAWLHLIVFDQIFLWLGRWELQAPAPAAATHPTAIAPPGTPHLPIRASTPPKAVRRRPV